jgi:hypothetical protein
MQGSGQIWSQQSQGCQKSGDFIYLPHESLGHWNPYEPGSQLFEQWLRLRYGLFTNHGLDSNVTSGSIQDSQCFGSSPASIVLNHSDQKSSHFNPKGALIHSGPTFTVSREEAPKYVIVLENSVAMSMNNTWDMLRTALKKFLIHDLQDDAQVGLVLFNEAAIIASSVSRVGPKNGPQRTDTNVLIESKYTLSPKLDSCVRCGLLKAIEALQTSGSTIGASIIMISQGHINVLSREDERELVTLSKKHQLRLYTMPLVQHKNNVSILFETMSFVTGGSSFLIQQKNYLLDVYLDVINALREIRSRSESNGPALVSFLKLLFI